MWHLGKLLFATSIFFSSHFSYAFNLDKHLEDRLLNAEWDAVISYLAGDDKKVSDVVARLLMGHAALATNRNNSSFLLFSSIEDIDLEAWAQWTNNQIKKHPSKAVLSYLAADAAMRKGKRGEAMRLLDLSIKNAKKTSVSALALNAKGVINLRSDQIMNAQIEFQRAIDVSPNFADAYANLGAASVLMEASLAISKKPLDFLNKAIKINPRFSLALNSRGCLNFGNGRFANAEKDFKDALRWMPELLIAEANLNLNHLDSSHKCKAD